MKPYIIKANKMEHYETIDVRHIEDARYLHYCGLFVRNYRDKMVDVLEEHADLAKRIMSWRPEMEAKFRRR